MERKLRENVEFATVQANIKYKPTGYTAQSFKTKFH